MPRFAEFADFGEGVGRAVWYMCVRGDDCVFGLAGECVMDGMDEADGGERDGEFDCAGGRFVGVCDEHV